MHVHYRTHQVLLDSILTHDQTKILLYIHKNSFNVLWLEKDFLGYPLLEWETSVAAHDGFTACEKAMMTLSSKTIEGLRMTGISVSVYNYNSHVHINRHNKIIVYNV